MAVTTVGNNPHYRGGCSVGDEWETAFAQCHLVAPGSKTAGGGGGAENTFPSVTLHI